MIAFLLRSVKRSGNSLTELRLGAVDRCVKQPRYGVDWLESTTQRNLGATNGTSGRVHGLGGLLCLGPGKDPGRLSEWNTNAKQTAHCLVGLESLVDQRLGLCPGSRVAVLQEVIQRRGRAGLTLANITNRHTGLARGDASNVVHQPGTLGGLSNLTNSSSTESQIRQWVQGNFSSETTNGVAPGVTTPGSPVLAGQVASCGSVVAARPVPWRPLVNGVLPCKDVTNRRAWEVKNIASGRQRPQGPITELANDRSLVLFREVRLPLSACSTPASEACKLRVDHA